jgi:uncharacterized protein
MLLDLRGVRGGSEEFHRQYQPEVFPPAPGDFRIVAPVDLALRVTKDARKIRVTGRLRTALEVECSRCLEPFRVPVDAEIDQIFLPEGTEVTGASDDDAEDDEGQQADAGVSFYKDDTIDLGEMMRDEFYLALPMKPLCKDDCKGLCPVCGVNWNRETCTCKVEWTDPRMASLKTLLKHDD